MKHYWRHIIDFNDKYFPNWRKNKETIFFSNALAGETGEICNLVKKLYGGGTNNKLPKHKLRKKILTEGIDVFIYLVLLYESLGYDWKNFTHYFHLKITELKKRMNKKQNKLDSLGGLFNED